MRKEKTKKIPAREEQVIDYVECDICGKQTKNRPYRGKVDWDDSDYEKSEVTIQLNTGENYPEGSWGNVVFFDICDECFTSKVIPALESLGAKKQEEEWDY